MKGSRLVALVGTIAALSWWAGASAQSGRRYIEPSLASGTGRPFSGGVLIGDTFYLSGTLGLEANQQVPGTAEAEAANVLNNVQKTLSQAGLTKRGFYEMFINNEG